MSRATSGFLAGLVSGGLGTYLKMKDVERADAKEKRDQETFDYLKDQRERELATQQRTDAAIQDYAGLADGVVDTNTSGFSDPSAAMLHKQGGQQLVDETASYANLENARMGIKPSYATAGEGGAPTVTRRQATPVDRAAAFEKIAIAKGDVAGIEKAAQAKQKAIWDAEDMDAAKLVMTNPTGPEAQALLGLVKQSIPGSDIALDPKTSMYVGKIADKDVSLSPAQLGQLAVVRNQIGRGDANALSTLAGIDKDLAGAGAGIWKTQLEMAKFNNEAINKGATMADNATRTGIAVEANQRAGQAHGVAMAEKAADLSRQAAEPLVREAELLRTNPNAAPSQIAAARTGQLDPFKANNDANAPSEVKLARAYVAAGLAPDMAAGLKMATMSKDYSPEKVRADIYGKALTASYGNAARAQEATDQAMSYLFPAPAPKPSGATRKPQNVTPADIAATAKKYGISEAEVRKQLGL